MRTLGQGADALVEVRSSGTAEGTEAASFAGMNETFLNVRGPDAVVDALPTREPRPAFVLELRCECLPRVGPIREERYVGPELVHRTDRVSG